jgi:hypothetical protein
MRTESLIEALGLKDLTPEEQEELLLDLNELVYKGAMVRILSSIDDDTKAALEQLLDTDPDEDTLQDFLDKNVPGASQAVEDTIQEIRDDILGVTGASQD